MRKVLVMLLMLVPVSTWAKDSSNVDERKVAEEDICQARLEYAEADRLFFRETGGMYSTTSPEARYARDRDLKLRRLMLQENRYAKRFGQPFKGTCRF